MNMFHHDGHSLRQGDKVFVYKVVFNGPAVKHYGIYVQIFGKYSGVVVHNSMENGKVVVSSVADFSKGERVFIESRSGDNWNSQTATVERAFRYVGTPFNLVNFNCEHFANLAQSGEASSLQLQNICGGALLLSLIGFCLLGVSSRR